MSFITSSIGKKVTMSLTGLFLISFLVIHLLGNFQLLSESSYGFNRYALFMTTNPLIKIVSYVLYASILYHAILGLVLVFKNRGARKNKYAVSAGNTNSPWMSRYMGILGTIILVFIVIHMNDFWREYHTEGEIDRQLYSVYQVDGVEYHDELMGPNEAPLKFVENGFTDETIAMDAHFESYTNLYLEVQEAFHNMWYVLFYVLSMAAICFHLLHGFKSSIQSLGINSPRMNRIVKIKGIIIATIIPAAFAAIPLYIFFTK
jgi:succinate dehydrogenase / fumarate reductase cytochrome b subunit